MGADGLVFAATVFATVFMWITMAHWCRALEAEIRSLKERIAQIELRTDAR